jgi:hypothetical protein
MQAFAVVAVVALASAVGAQPPAEIDGSAGRGPGGGPGGFRPPPDPIREALDANHDQQLDADEIKNASAALLALDTDGDGVLGHDEIRPPLPPGMPDRGGRSFDGGPRRQGGRQDRGGPDGPGGGGPGGPRGAGPSPERFVERAMACDADGDGKLDRDELRTCAEEMQRKRGGPGNSPGQGPGGRRSEPPPPPSE